jgi:hypothetical protein
VTWDGYKGGSSREQKEEKKKRQIIIFCFERRIGRAGSTCGIKP